MEELIGMSFKRNVYGPSLWTDVVKRVWIRWYVEGTLMNYHGDQKAEIMIEGSVHSFPLSEVVFQRQLDFNQKLSLGKELQQDKMRKEWINKLKFKKE